MNTSYICTLESMIFLQNSCQLLYFTDCYFCPKIDMHPKHLKRSKSLQNDSRWFISKLAIFSSAAAFIKTIFNLAKKEFNGFG